MTFPATDREVDREIAEKVMGWSKLVERSICDCCTDPVIDLYGCPPLNKHDGSKRYLKYPSCSRCHQDIGQWKKIEVTHEREASVPEFSTRIFDAFEVVARMREQGWFLQLGLMGFGREWEAVFDNRAISYAGVSESAPRAICLAALSAMTEGEA